MQEELLLLLPFLDPSGAIAVSLVAFLGLVGMQQPSQYLGHGFDLLHMYNGF